MQKLSASRFFYLLALILPLAALTLGCKKEDTNPLLACRPPQTGTGIGTPNPRTLMFWIDQDFRCGNPTLIEIRNTETNTTSYSGSSNAYISKYFSTQPACGTTGCITIQVSKGYEYEYTIACTGRQWKARVTVDCNNDCIPIKLQ